MSLLPDCDRCGAASERLYEFPVTNEDEETTIKKICWDCDHDIINGGEYYDIGEVLMDREENNYAFDPIYYPKPSWMP